MKWAHSVVQQRKKTVTWPSNVHVFTTETRKAVTWIIPGISFYNWKKYWLYVVLEVILENCVQIVPFLPISTHVVC